MDATAHACPPVPPLPKSPARQDSPLTDCESPKASDIDTSATLSLNTTSSIGSSHAISHDPVFGEGREALAAQLALVKIAIQPPDHSFPHLFPSVANLLGLTRWIPEAISGLVPSVDGPPCSSHCKAHSTSIPAFLYL